MAIGDKVGLETIEEFDRNLHGQVVDVEARFRTLVGDLLAMVAAMAIAGLESWNTKGGK